MKPPAIESFFATLKAANPHPVTELEYTSVFELLAAVLLSAQATDVSVNKATRKLFPIANTPQALLDLGLERVERAIQTIGLYRTKARNLLETCRILIERHHLHTGSKRAAEILDNWDKALLSFVKVMPKDYRRALTDMARERAAAAAVAAE